MKLLIVFAILSLLVCHNHHKHDHEHDHHHHIDHHDHHHHLEHHDHHHDHNHTSGYDHQSHDHHHGLVAAESYLKNLLTPYFSDLNAEQASYFGALICSLASIPVLILFSLFKVKNGNFLDMLSAFSVGALLADALLHSLPEIANNKNNLIIVCLSIFAFHLIDMFISKLFTNHTECGHNHGTNISAILGDFLHNFTDGIAIAASFAVSRHLNRTKLGDSNSSRYFLP